VASCFYVRSCFGGTRKVGHGSDAIGAFGRRAATQGPSRKGGKRTFGPDILPAFSGRKWGSLEKPQKLFMSRRLVDLRLRL
jgi:hypothetical protein